MPLLELHNLKKYYATQKAVDDISFSVEPGTIFGLLGPNGAGKTTLLRMITGILFPDEGEILFEGKHFNPMKDVERIGYMPEERGLYKKNEDRRTGALPGAAQRTAQGQSHVADQGMVCKVGNAKLVE
jgi:ABC-type uncharacterized transport system ATPase subunit